MNKNNKSAFSKQPEMPADNSNYKKIDDLLAATEDKNETTRIYTPEHADNSSFSSKIKIEISTRLETILLYLAGASALAVPILYIFSLETKKHQPNPALFKCMPYFALLAGVFILCWFLADNFYIMHTDKRKLLYHFKFFGITKITEIIDFEMIYAIGVTGHRAFNKNREIWSYYIFMADKTGKLTVLSDHKAEGKLIELNTRARAMASIAGCVCAEAGANTEIRLLKTGPDKISMNYNRFSPPVTGLDEIKEIIRGDYLKEMDGGQKTRIALLLIAGAVIIISAIIYFPDMLKSLEPQK